MIKKLAGHLRTLSWSPLTQSTRDKPTNNNSTQERACWGPMQRKKKRKFNGWAHLCQKTINKLLQNPRNLKESTNEWKILKMMMRWVKRQIYRTKLVKAPEKKQKLKGNDNSVGRKSTDSPRSERSSCRQTRSSSWRENNCAPTLVKSLWSTSARLRGWSRCLQRVPSCSTSTTSLLTNGTLKLLTGIQAPCLCSTSISKSYHISQNILSRKTWWDSCAKLWTRCSWQQSASSSASFTSSK